MCVMSLCCGERDGRQGRDHTALGLVSLTSISGLWAIEGSAISDSWLWRYHSRLQEAEKGEHGAVASRWVKE